MFRLMVFNVLCGNRDDHAKNFSFLYKGKEGWSLSPAYDLTVNSGVNGEHATTVNGKGCGITDNDMLAVARNAGLARARARRIIDQVRDVLGDMR